MREYQRKTIYLAGRGEGMAEGFNQDGVPETMVRGFGCIYEEMSDEQIEKLKEEHPARWEKKVVVRVAQRRLMSFRGRQEGTFCALHPHYHTARRVVDDTAPEEWREFETCTRFVTNILPPPHEPHAVRILPIIARTIHQRAAVDPTTEAPEQTERESITFRNLQDIARILGFEMPPV